MYKYPKEKTTIEVKFLPNYDLENDKIGDYITELYLGVENEDSISSVFFSKVYMNGEITILKYGKQIRKILQSFLDGCYLNSEGLFISDENNQKIYDEDNDEYSLTEYYIDEDGDVLLPYDTFDCNMSKLEHRTDIVYQERFNPYDLASKFYLQFDIDWVMDGRFIKYNNFRLIEKDALWTEGDDKEKIKSMFKGVETIEECITKYKKETNKKFSKTLFGEDALLQRNKTSAKKNIERKEGELAEMKERYNSKYNIS